MLRGSPNQVLRKKSPPQNRCQATPEPKADYRMHSLLFFKEQVHSLRMRKCTSVKPYAAAKRQSKPRYSQCFPGKSVCRGRYELYLQRHQVLSKAFHRIQRQRIRFLSAEQFCRRLRNIGMGARIPAAKEIIPLWKGSEPPPEKFRIQSGQRAGERQQPAVIREPPVARFRLQFRLRQDAFASGKVCKGNQACRLHISDKFIR